MKFPKRMKPIIIDGHEAVEWFKSKRYAKKRKQFHELNGFHVILHRETEHWGGWFICVRAGGLEATRK
jgi:hypothetical protein